MERSVVLRVVDRQAKGLTVVGPPASGHPVRPRKERSACEIGSLCEFWIGLDKRLASKSEVSKPRC